MAQALIKVNMSPKLRKNNFFHKKCSLFSKFSFLVKSSFLKTIFTHSKNQPHTLAQHVLTQQTPIIFSCYYKPPKCGTAAKRRYRKKTNSEGRGARRQGLTRPQGKPNTRPFKRAIVRFSGTRSCGDND